MSKQVHSAHVITTNLLGVEQVRTLAVDERVLEERCRAALLGHQAHADVRGRLARLVFDVGIRLLGHTGGL